jgi:hypothetical protein
VQAAHSSILHNFRQMLQARRGDRMKWREFITPLWSSASKTNATKQNEEIKDGLETPRDSPPIDRWDDAIKKLIRGAKKRGYVTYDQINVLLPSEEVKSEQIEDILAMFCEMGVNVVETKEADPEETLEDVKKEPEEEESDGDLTEVQRSTPAETKKSEPGERTDDPVRMYLREWARSSCSHRHVARAQNNHPAGRCRSPARALHRSGRARRRRTETPAPHSRNRFGSAEPGRPHWRDRRAGGDRAARAPNARPAPASIGPAMAAASVSRRPEQTLAAHSAERQAARRRSRSAAA